MIRNPRGSHRPIYPRKCYRCGKPATRTLFNTRNAEIADYCTAHAKAALDDFRKTEEEDIEILKRKREET
jgi:hypothetical protein